ncbi:MAG: hypothetical protein ACHQF3_01565 [Alphaproteobacteria bacterium]
MRKTTLVALTIAATSAALYTTGDAQTKTIPAAPPRPAPAMQCAMPNPTVIAANDRMGAQLADIDQNLGQIVYYLCLIESDMSRDKADK